LAALGRRGHATVEAPGRRIVKQESTAEGSALLCVNEAKRQDTWLQQFSKFLLTDDAAAADILTIVEAWNALIMDEKRALAALGALAQETRLALFRLLVTAGPAGLPAGVIAERLGVQPSSLSFHLAQLVHAGLITQRRLGRQLIYSAEYGAMNALLAYLTENCCGRDRVNAPVRDPAAGCCSNAAEKTTAA
jgi:ArsR family transcriptional regulator, arsenate/arsenite/antimonite-responsive transcriptional repressor